MIIQVIGNRAPCDSGLALRHHYRLRGDPLQPHLQLWWFDSTHLSQTGEPQRVLI